MLDVNRILLTKAKEAEQDAQTFPAGLSSIVSFYGEALAWG